MIELITLLHGLLVGPVELQVQVPEGTVSIVVELDERRLLEHHGPPWQFHVPFPDTPRPARLTLTALGADGHPAARLERRINLGVESCAPPVASPAGGATPFLIDLGEGVADPVVADLQGRFEVAGRPLEVLAVSGGPSEVVVVQDPAMQETFALLSGAFEADPSRFAFDIEGRLQFLWTSGPPIARLNRQTAVFPRIGSFDAEAAGMLWHLNDAAEVDQQRLADAVAVAGWQVAATCRRRAVVVFESVLSLDSSLLEAEAVRAYLHSAQVPIFVLRDRRWPGEPGGDEPRGGPDPWHGAAWSIDGSEGSPVEVFSRFQEHIEHTLDRQRVVWLAGEHLPGEIELQAQGARFVAAAGQDQGHGRATLREGGR